MRAVGWFVGGPDNGVRRPLNVAHDIHEVPVYAPMYLGMDWRALPEAEHVFHRAAYRRMGRMPGGHPDEWIYAFDRYMSVLPQGVYF